MVHIPTGAWECVAPSVLCSYSEGGDRTAGDHSPSLSSWPLGVTLSPSPLLSWLTASGEDALRADCLGQIAQPRLPVLSAMPNLLLMGKVNLVLFGAGRKAAPRG